MTRSEELLARARRVIPGGVSSPVRAFKAVGGSPPFVARAEGARVFDEDGGAYIDYVGSCGPMIHGHAHPEILEAVAEAAVVGFPHEIKGQGIYAYVALTSEYANQDLEQVKGALKEQVRQVIGKFAAPDVIHIASGLPKTRSGKIMRRILRKIAAAEYDSLGDVSTLAEPEVVELLVTEHKAENK